MGIHGGLDETSLMLHLPPDLVDLAAGFRNMPEPLAANRHVRFGGAVSFGWLSNDFGPSGHIGDPTGATAERGKLLFEAPCARFGEALAEVAHVRLRPAPAPDLPAVPAGSSPGLVSAQKRRADSRGHTNRRADLTTAERPPPCSGPSAPRPRS